VSAGIRCKPCDRYTPGADGGLDFDPQTVDAQRIKEYSDYEGVRSRFRGQLGNARVHIQVNLGRGDHVHYDAAEVDYPTMLNLPAPSLCVYFATGK